MKQKAFWLVSSVFLASSGLAVSAEGIGARPAATVVTSFSPVADATVDAALANSALGKATRIEVDALPQQRSLFRFDLSGLSGQVTEAKLKLFNLDGSGSGGRLVGMTNNSWNEATVTWNNAPGVGSTTVSSVASVSSGLYYEWDATSLIAGNGTVSMALRSDSSNGADYSSREGTATRIPQLIVTTSTTSPTPSPSPTPTAGPGSTATFLPVADATVRSDQSGANFGTVSFLETDGGPLRRAYLRFSVTGLTGPVTSARLSLLNTDPSGFGGAVHKVASTTWSETGVTWNNAPAFTSGPVASFGAVSVGSRYEVDVTSAVAGNGIISLALVSGNSNGADFGSRESGTSSTPRLIVTTTGTAPSPTPSPSPSPSPTPTPSPSPSASPGPEMVVAAAGNIACDPTDPDYNGGLGTPGGGCRFKETSDVVASIDPDAVLPLGDNQYEGGALVNYQSVYEPTWGRFRSISHPTPGNHEYEVPGAADYFSYFGSQAPAPYYSFDLGAWHLVSLNSEVSRGVGSAQELWLRQDLASTNKECVLAYWHRARFSSGPSGGAPTMEPLFRALRDNDVEILLSAHDHFYERFAPQDAAGTPDPLGVRQFVVGTGGKSRHSAQIVKANSEVRGSTYGALKLTLRPGNFDWRFVAIPTSSFTDSGSGTCH